MTKFVFLLFTFCLFIQITNSQTSLTSSQAYDKAQKARSDASDLWGKDRASDSEIKQGIDILNNTIRFLDSFPIRELEQGNLYLKARKHDVYYDLTMAYLTAGDSDKALTALENMCDQGATFSFSLEKDSIFIPLWSTPRFKKVIEILKNRDARWKDKAFTTPFKANLSEEEKIAGLTLLWSQAKYNFVHFDHAGIDWDKTYLDYLPAIKNTKNTLDYYKVLQLFYAQLKDGHTNVYPPNELFDSLYSRPPFRTELIEGKVYVTDVFSDSLQKTGIVPGLQVLAINSIPVLEYAEKQVIPYQSSSTPQDREVRAFNYALLSGNPVTPLVLTLSDSKGKKWIKTVSRTGYNDVKSTPGFLYKEIGNIGYLTINTFEDNSIRKQFDSIYPQIAKTKGLIIDVRKNGGGSSNNGYYILKYLTDKTFKTSSYRIPKYQGLPGIGMHWDEYASGDIDPNGKQHYSKPVIVLISARTFSAAEDFAVAFDYMKRGKLIGQATGGSTGQPILFDLPGGGRARICGKSDFYPDGKIFVGTGVQPDITITKTIKDLLSNRDAVLEEALQILNK